MEVRELVAHLGLEIDQASFEKGKAAIESLHLGFKAFAVGASVAAAGALVYFAKETAEAADAAGKLAQSTGLNSEFLQKLGYAADLADVSTEQLAVGLRHLAKTGVKDVQGSILQIADQFQKLPNDGAKVALAMEKFGKSGAALIPLLNGGAKSIEELMQEAEDLGLVFSEEDSKAAEEFNDDTKRLSKSLTGLRNDIGRGLIPVLHKLVNGMRAFMKQLRAALPTLKTFGAIIKTVAIIAIASLTAALLANISAVIFTISWYAALRVAAIRAALSAAASWAFAALPFVIIAALITALILLLEDLYGYINGSQSLIGKLMPSFERFLFEFTRPRAGEPWFIHMLRFAVELLTGAQDNAAKLNNSLSSIGLGKIDYSKPLDAQNINAAVFGGGATSTAKAGEMTKPTVKQTKVTINSPVTINAPNANAQDVKAQFDRQVEATYRAAIAGSGGG